MRESGNAGMRETDFCRAMRGSYLFPGFSVSRFLAFAFSFPIAIRDG
jgi:hypothetical protein